MGFLIGKANETLQEFETTNQNIRFDDFINPERSINKSAQAYAFREKGIFEYEFQFMSDLNYRNLLYLIKNRSSLREGLISIPIPYSSEPDSTILLPTVSTTNKAYYGGYLEAVAKPWEVVWSMLPKIELRTRFNAHRNIKLYAYLSPEEVTWEKLKDKKYLKLLRTLKGGLK